MDSGNLVFRSTLCLVAVGIPLILSGGLLVILVVASALAGEHPDTSLLGAVVIFGPSCALCGYAVGARAYVERGALVVRNAFRTHRIDRRRISRLRITRANGPLGTLGFRLLVVEVRGTGPIRARGTLSLPASHGHDSMVRFALQVGKALTLPAGAAKRRPHRYVSVPVQSGMPAPDPRGVSVSLWRGVLGSVRWRQTAVPMDHSIPLIFRSRATMVVNVAVFAVILAQFVEALGRLVEPAGPYSRDAGIFGLASTAAFAACMGWIAPASVRVVGETLVVRRAIRRYVIERGRIRQLSVLPSSYGPAVSVGLKVVAIELHDGSLLFCSDSPAWDSPPGEGRISRFVDRASLALGLPVGAERTNLPPIRRSHNGWAELRGRRTLFF